MSWQPIETAPKDGTKILACSSAVFAAWGNKPAIRITWWRSRANGDGYDGWGEFNATHWPATHWMPLPEPPTQTQTEPA